MALPAFAHSEPFTLGVELELQLVDLHRHDLVPAAPDLLGLLRHQRLAGEVKPEITQAMIEISTGVCRHHGEVLGQLEAWRDALVTQAQHLGIGVCGGGTHPFQDWSERQIHPSPRFQGLAEMYGYLAKQFTVFGQHVHVGVADPAQALPLLHRLSRFVPHLIALSAASPFVRGVDTSFQTARLNTVSAFPLSGTAPFLLDWPAFEAHVDRLTRSGIVRGMKDFYWDIRPKPEFGTVEVRVMDTPLTIERAADLAALVQCLARWLVLEQPFALGEDDYLPYAYNRFQACRWGLEAQLVDPQTHEPRTLREDFAQLWPQLAPHAQALGAEAALARLHREVLRGDTDAGWLRRTRSEHDDISVLVARQAERWRA